MKTVFMKSLCINALVAITLFCEAQMFDTNGTKVDFGFPVGISQSKLYMFPSWQNDTVKSADTIKVKVYDLETFIQLDTIQNHRNILQLIPTFNLLAGAKIYLNASALNAGYNLIVTTNYYGVRNTVDTVPVYGKNVARAYIYDGAHFKPVVNNSIPASSSGDTSILFHLRISGLASHSAAQADSAVLRVDTNGTTTTGCYFSCSDTNGSLASRHYVDSIAASGSGGAYWSLTGNAGTSNPTNFIGTTDAQNVSFERNGYEAMRISFQHNNQVVSMFDSLGDIMQSNAYSYSTGTILNILGDVSGNYNSTTLSVNDAESRVAITNSLQIMDGTQANYYVLTCDSTGFASWQTAELDTANLVLHAWGLYGNAGTNPALSYIGTTDLQPVTISSGNPNTGSDFSWMQFQKPQSGQPAIANLFVQDVANNRAIQFIVNAQETGHGEVWAINTYNIASDSISSLNGGLDSVYIGFQPENINVLTVTPAKTQITGEDLVIRNYTSPGANGLILQDTGGACWIYKPTVGTGVLVASSITCP